MPLPSGGLQYESLNWAYQKYTIENCGLIIIIPFSIAVINP